MKKALLMTSIAAILASGMAYANDHDGKGKKGHKHHGKMFERVDADHDGVITKAESDAFHEQKFKEMDANSDGKITKEEGKAHWEKKKAEYKARKEEMRKKREAEKGEKPAAE